MLLLFFFLYSFLVYPFYHVWRYIIILVLPVQLSERSVSGRLRPTGRGQRYRAVEWHRDSNHPTRWTFKIVSFKWFFLLGLFGSKCPEAVPLFVSTWKKQKKDVGRSQSVRSEVIAMAAGFAYNPAFCIHSALHHGLYAPNVYLFFFQFERRKRRRRTGRREEEGWLGAGVVAFRLCMCVCACVCVFVCACVCVWAWRV